MPIKMTPNGTGVQRFMQRSPEVAGQIIQQANDCGMSISKGKVFARVPQNEIFEESHIYNQQVTNSARVRVIEQGLAPLYCSYECQLADTNASCGIMESDYNLDHQSPPPVPHSSVSSLVFSTSQDSKSDSSSATDSSVKLTNTNHCHARFAPLYGFPPLHTLTIIPPAPESSTGIRLLTLVMSQSIRSVTLNSLPLEITSSTPVGPIIGSVAGIAIQTFILWYFQRKRTSSSQAYYFDEPSLADMLSSKDHHGHNVEPFSTTATTPASPSTHFVWVCSLCAPTAVRIIHLTRMSGILSSSYIHCDMPIVIPANLA